MTTITMRPGATARIAKETSPVRAATISPPAPTSTSRKVPQPSASRRRHSRRGSWNCESAFAGGPGPALACASCTAGPPSVGTRTEAPANYKRERSGTPSALELRPGRDASYRGSRDTCRMDANPSRAARAWALLRIGLAWIFLWAFIDKALGLGYATAPAAAWVHGGSPTTGFLKFAVNPDSPFASLFKALAGQAWVDWLFMLGLLGIGLALLLGIGMRAAAWAGALLLLMMYLAEWPLHVTAPATSNNPLVDDHVIYIIALFALLLSHAGDAWGL